MKWIKHDTDANADAKLQNVLLDYGLEGYGLYWYCIELIAQKVDKDNITFDLEHDARIIARNTGSTTQKIEEMMRYFVKTGLFESSQGVITCLKIARRLDKSMTSNPQMREIIENLKSHDSIMTQSGNHMQDQIRSDQTREEENENTSPESIYIPMFDQFWDLYAKKVGRPKSENEWLKISKMKDCGEIFKKIFESVPIYVASNQDKKFRKDPERWLKHKCWNDEITVSTEEQLSLGNSGDWHLEPNNLPNY